MKALLEAGKMRIMAMVKEHDWITKGGRDDVIMLGTAIYKFVSDPVLAQAAAPAGDSDNEIDALAKDLGLVVVETHKGEKGKKRPVVGAAKLVQKWCGEAKAKKRKVRDEMNKFDESLKTEKAEIATLKDSEEIDLKEVVRRSKELDAKRSAKKEEVKERLGIEDQDKVALMGNMCHEAAKLAAINFGMALAYHSACRTCGL